MDQPLFPERYAEIRGTPMVGQLAQNQVTRNMAHAFHRFQAARVPGAGTHPHMDYHPSPTDPDTMLQPSAVEVNPPASTLPTCARHPRDDASKHASSGRGPKGRA
eukprot:1628094-Pyramimonas_sp.AAC.1